MTNGRFSRRNVLVAGAGGFIGGHLVAELLQNGANVRAIDRKPITDWHQVYDDATNAQLDLAGIDDCRAAVIGCNEVFNLAADMGGMGFIESHKADCMLSALINTHLLMAAADEGVDRYFFSSSACVYAAEKQVDAAVTALQEQDAYPAMPEDGYGWEKLFSERMCRHFREDYGLPTRVARYHNVYGPHGTWSGGREKAPAALSRKIAMAAITGKHEIEIWGDGEQTRSFMYIDDCIRGTQMLAASDVVEPLNLGSSELVSINQLVDLIESIAGFEVDRHYNLDAPKGVRGRNSDNTLIQEHFGWEPSITLREGMTATYAWVYEQVERSLSADAIRSSAVA